MAQSSCLVGETILLMAYSTWDTFRQDNELALVLAQENRVLYVEKQARPGTMWLGAPREAARRWRARAARQVAANLFVLSTPPLIPWLAMLRPRGLKRITFHASLHLNARVLETVVDGALRTLRWAPTVFWCYEPDSLLLRGHFRVKWAGYRVYDEITLFPFWDCIRAEYDEFERGVIREADFVFASSRAQADKRRAWHPRVYHVPNACDFERYSRYNGGGKVPARPADLPAHGPILMFVGSIDYRLDYDLLSQLAAHNPRWELVFVGPIKASSAGDGPHRLVAFGNVHMLGEKPPWVLPDYVYYADACLIPYRLTESTCTMFPWKVYEHLATGKPVVATRLPELERLSDAVYLADGTREFERAVGSALGERSRARREARIGLARRNTWSARIREVCDICGG